MGGVRQHVQPGLVRMGAAVLVDGFGYAKQQFAGMGKDFRSSDVWVKSWRGGSGTSFFMVDLSFRDRSHQLDLSHGSRWQPYAG